MKSAFLKFWDFLGRLADESGSEEAWVDHSQPQFGGPTTPGCGIPLLENDLGLLIVNRWEPPPADPGQWDSPWDR